MMAAAAIVIFLMTAVKAFPMAMSALVIFTVVMSAFMAFTLVMSALVPSAVVMSALMTFTMMLTVVVASGIGIKLERALGKSPGSRVSRTGNAAVKPDARLCQRILCSHANAAADQAIYLSSFQETG